ncbi:MAG TPA: SAM-dependent methyltransferase, partial [Candidatus Binatia bacterium]|nr:SAM-dependent methyltransferase [Candidatus Binatia bacterium]
MTSSEWVAEESSFRDPSGFVFYRENQLYRQINRRYEADYNQLIQSGLYEALVDSNLLVSHKEVDIAPARERNFFRIIKPDVIPFISYPYEWCFSELKDAALLTLNIQKIALNYGMSLRDCSAFNIQFTHARPILIDTLSFGIYNEGEPWAAYKQFCQHFLAPLMLMSRRDIRLNQLCVTELDGIPLKLARVLLSHRAYSSWPAFLHIYLHAHYENFYGERFVQRRAGGKRFGTQSFRGLIDSLESAVTNLTVKQPKSEWLAYATEGHNYGDDSLNHKMEIVDSYLRRCNPREVWDLGANTGLFSRVASAQHCRVIAFDQDPHCVEANYVQTRK